MIKKLAFLLTLTISPVGLFAQDWVPVITGFGYEASECHLRFSCYVKNIDDDNDAEATAYKIIIFNISDHTEIFNTDVPLDQINRLSSSPSKSWNIDLPALAGYRPSVSYKIAVVANTNDKFEFDKKNNRVESAQFACGEKALNDSPPMPASDGSGKTASSTTPASSTASTATTMKDMAKDMADMKASRDQMAAQAKASQEEQKQTLTTKTENLRQKVAKRIVERDQYARGTQEWSDLAYEVADLEYERQISELELEKVTDELAYGSEGLSKSEKERYKTKTDKLETLQGEARKAKKNGVMYDGPLFGGNTTTTVTETKPVVETKKEEVVPKPEVVVEPKKEETVEPKKETTEVKHSNNPRNNPEEEETTKFYTAEEMAQLSTNDLKRIKFDSNTTMGKRKLKLKTKSNALTPAEKTALQAEIDQLTKQIELAEAELTKREKE